MIIKRSVDCYSIELEREDWWCLTTYILLELLKSTPKEYRRYDPIKKIWIISNKYLNLIEKVQHYTSEEDKQGLEEFNQFWSKLDSDVHI